MSSDFKIRTIFISNFLLDFWEGDIFTLNKTFLLFFLSLCSDYCSAVRISFFFCPSQLIAFCTQFFRDFYEGIYRTTSKNTKTLFITLVLENKKNKKWLVKLHGIAGYETGKYLCCQCCEPMTRPKEEIIQWSVSAFDQ